MTTTHSLKIADAALKIADAAPKTADAALKIADAGERTSAFRRARFNSAFVRTMRLVLPVGAVLLLGTYGLFMQHTITVDTKSHAGKIDTGRVSLSSLNNLAMSNPSYEGYGKKDGSRYRLSAKKAITDLSRDKPIKLERIDGAFEQANGQRTRVKATHGVFDQKLGQLNLTGGINVDAPNGLSVALNSAVVDTKTSEITSKEPVHVLLPAGEVRSNAMHLDQRKRQVLFQDGVAAQLRPPTRKAKTGTVSAETPEANGDPGSLLGFGSGASGQPVDITSTTLAIAGKTRKAHFKGKVRAFQNGRSLETSVLTVSFAGGAALTSLGGPGESAGGGRVEKIEARDGVKLSQGNNDIRARTAIFDVITDKAELKGGVRISAPAGRTIKADHAAIDTKTNRIVLTGGVVATQADNLFRGNRMIYEPKIGRLRLASPAIDGAPGGNIFVRFKPPASGKRRRNRHQPARGGLSFSTNPDAPIEIVARSLDVVDPKSTARFDGGVKARQGDLLIKTRVLSAHYKGRIGLFQGAGAPKRRGRQMKLRYIRATQPVEVTSGSDTKANGERAEFDLVRNLVTISGNVVVTHGRQIARGDKLVIDLKTGLSRMKTAPRARVTAKPLTFGAQPTITKDPKRRDCGGKMCLVFYPRDAKKLREQRRNRPAGEGAPARQISGQPRERTRVGDGWSASTNTN